MKILENINTFDRTVCENVKWLFDDAEEIGSSDVNACVNNVLNDLGVDPKEATNEEFFIVKRAVNNAIGNLDFIRAHY